MLLPAQAVAAAAARVAVRLEAIDGTEFCHLRQCDRRAPAAVRRRRFMQSVLRVHLADVPSHLPFHRLPPRLPFLASDIVSRWPAAEPSGLLGSSAALAALPADHGVPVVQMKGGSVAAHRRLARPSVRNRLRQ